MLRRIVLDLSQVTPHVSGPDTVQTMQSVAAMEQKKVAIQKAYLVSCVNSRVDDLEAAAWVLCGKKVAPSVKLYVGAASAWTQQEAEKRGVWQALLRCRSNSTPAQLRTLHRSRNRTSGEQVRSASRPPTAISKAAWDRERLSAISPVPRSLQLQPSPVTSRGLVDFQSAHLARNYKELAQRRTHRRARGNTARISRARARPARVHAAGQRQHRRHLRQGLHLSR